MEKRETRENNRIVSEVLVTDLATFQMPLDTLFTKTTSNKPTNLKFISEYSLLWLQLLDSPCSVGKASISFS